MYAGVEIQSSTFFKYKAIIWDFPHIHAELSETQSKISRVGHLQAEHQAAVKKQRNNKKTKLRAKVEVKKINTTKLKSKNPLMPRREEKKTLFKKPERLARTPSEDSRQLIRPLLRLPTASL